MAIAVATNSVPFGAVTIFHLVNKLDAIKNSVLDWNTRRLTLNALSSLSDAQMEDIGLTRGDLGRLPVQFGRY
jgi:uncharacterized protein YjiS (DUF1127 family)